MIIALRTDKPRAEVYILDKGVVLSGYEWEAHRALAETLFGVIRQRLTEHGVRLEDVTGIICYEGPGSYTGLRIGMSVANALAYSYGIPVVAAGGEHWRQEGLRLIAAKPDNKLALPVYGGPAFASAPKK